MKSLFVLLVAGGLLALGGAFAELWTLPFLEGVPSYSQLGEKRARATEERVHQDGPDFQAPFASRPNAESSRRSAEMQAAREEIGGR